MKKFLWRAAGILAVIGVALCIAGVLRGGRPMGIQLGWANGHLQVNYAEFPREMVNSSSAETGTPEQSQTIHSLEVELGAARVRVLTGKAFSLEVSDGATHTQQVDNGVWRIEGKGKPLTKETLFTITVPAGLTLQQVSLEMGAGQLEAEGLVCQQADLEVGAGTMDFVNCTVQGPCEMEVGMGMLQFDGTLNQGASINCSMGSVKCLLSRPQSYGFTVDCGVGNVCIDQWEYSGVGTEVRQNTQETVLYQIDCGMGQVSVQFAE